MTLKPFLLTWFALALPAAAAELTVSAASSLSNAFTDLGRAYERQYPGAKVAFNFGASGALLQQLAKGAPADVFAAADQETMDLAQVKNLVSASARRNFASNALVVIAPLGSNTPLARLADLTAPAIARIAIGNPDSVPAGRYASRALRAAHLWPVLQGKAITTQNVRQSLDYVARGEVDAGFVYATDAALMKDKVRLAFGVALDMPLLYPIAPLAASTNGAEAQRFIDFVMSPAGQAVLRQYGFRQL
ncbi:MAG: molybdate ABC transporter substrate-binding protein [Pseudomonadota bacterium]